MRKFRKWRLIFFFVSLVWIIWMIKVGETEFYRINNQYREIANQFDANKLKAAAIKQLTAECIRKTFRNVDPKEAPPCSSWPSEEVEAKENIIEKQLLKAKAQAKVKVVMFYSIFVILFLLAPPFFLYLIIVGSIKVFSEIKIGR